MRSRSVHGVTAWARMATAGVVLFATAVLGLTTSPPSRSATTKVVPAMKTGAASTPAIVDSSDPAPPAMLHVQGPLMVIEVNVPRAKTRLNRRAR
jgi:hypothetical protein